MANKTVVFNNQYYNGDTSLTLFLLNPSDGSIGNGAGDTVTAGSNGSFSTIVTENITGWWKVIIFKSGNPILEDGWVYFPSNTAGTYVVDDPKTTWDEVLTGATHNIQSSAGRRLRVLADTVILFDGSAVDADNNGVVNGENGLGRIRLEASATTICLGQAIRVAGQVRYIVAFDNIDKWATVDNPWCSIPSIGDDYTVFNLRSPMIQRITSSTSDTFGSVLHRIWDMTEDSGGQRFTQKALEQVVQELNETDYDGVNFDDAIKIIMSMAQGRIVEVSPGVFDFYARDNSTILYRLTKSGNERTRS